MSGEEVRIDEVDRAKEIKRCVEGVGRRRFCPVLATLNKQCRLLVGCVVKGSVLNQPFATDMARSADDMAGVANLSRYLDFLV